MTETGFYELSLVPPEITDEPPDWLYVVDPRSKRILQRPGVGCKILLLPGWGAYHMRGWFPHFDVATAQGADKNSPVLLDATPGVWFVREEYPQTPEVDLDVYDGPSVQIVVGITPGAPPAIVPLGDGGPDIEALIRKFVEDERQFWRRSEDQRKARARKRKAKTKTQVTRPR